MRYLWAMRNYKIAKDIYSVKAYEALHFAVAQYGTSMHRELWDLMVDAGLNRKQIFTKYMKMIRTNMEVNRDILIHVVVKKNSGKILLASKNKTL